MDICIRQINIENALEVKSYVKWENDLEFYHFIAPMKSKDSKVEFVTEKSIIDFFKSNPVKLKNTYLIFDGEKPVGQFNIQIDPEHLFKKEANTCWPGIVIGEKDYWGSGVAAIAMKKIESIAKGMGMNRIELGVFEFNKRAQSFYKKLGYKNFGIIEDFTYWNGRFWNDLRLEKYL